MIKNSHTFFISLIFTGLPTILEAHSGHGMDGTAHSITHYLTEPFHIAVGASLAALVAAGFYISRKIRQGQQGRVLKIETRHSSDFEAYS